MSERTAVRRKTLSVAQVLDWPPIVPAWPDAGTALQISRTTTFQLIADGEFPVPVLRIGRLLRCRRSDLLAYMGLENGDGAGVPAPTPLAEQSATTRSSK